MNRKLYEAHRLLIDWGRDSEDEGEDESDE
jgi:hypothetical protein